MQLPEELLYGVDVAIRKLRPGASFQLGGTEFIEWSDPTGLPAPTWEEVMKQLEEDKQRAEQWLKKVEEAAL